MHPAFSVIFFTVSSGAGLGLLALTALLDGAGILGIAPAVEAEILLRGAIAGMALTVAGLASSTLHLANPKNAWRSAARFRTSWLSREAVFAMALLAAAAGYAALLFVGANALARGVLALLVVLLAWTVVICTAMIYASLKPIRQWHTRLTPAAYLALGHWSGALVLLTIMATLAPANANADAAPTLRLVLIVACVLGVAALVVKAAWWRRAAGESGSRTLEEAIGVAHGVRPPRSATAAGRSVMAARLFDVGHTQGTFLTREFVHRVDPARSRAVRLFALACAFLAPLALLVAAGTAAHVVQAATLLCLVGLVAERWLFFAEAKHTVRLYHGERRT